MYYEKKFLIGDCVKGKRTFNGEVIEGKFNGFHLYNKLNPKSVVGVIDTDERCYDVSVDSIELVESKDERIRKEIKPNHWKPCEFQLECLAKVIPHRDNKNDKK